MNIVTKSAVLVAAAISVTIALSGCSALSSVLGGDAARDEDGAIVEAGQTDVFTLAVGDCFNDDAFASETISEVPTVPCDQPHHNEVYFVYDMDEAEFPGQTATTDAAQARCEAEFPTFAGIAYADSTLAVFPITPSDQSWSQGDRVVLCGIYDAAGTQTTGTLAGAAR